MSIKHTFHTETVINSDIQDVWKMLTDLPQYSSWNPWVVEASGNVVVGGNVNVTVILNGRSINASHIILDVIPCKRLYWKDSGWNSLFVYADRCRDLEVLSEGKILLRQTLTIVGILSPLIKYIYGESLQQGIENESNAIKEKLEAKVI
jgi:hypothetical protein